MVECVLATGTRSRHNDPYVLEKLATIGLDRDSREVPWCPTQGALISVIRLIGVNRGESDARHDRRGPLEG